MPPASLRVYALAKTLPGILPALFPAGIPGELFVDLETYASEEIAERNARAEKDDRESKRATRKGGRRVAGH